MHDKFIKNSQKSEEVQIVINSAIDVIKSLGVPLGSFTPRRLEKIAMSFLSVLNIAKNNQWQTAKFNNGDWSITSREIIMFINKNFEEKISSGSYDDIRRKDLKPLIIAGIIDRSANNPNTNNPTRGYALNQEFHDLITSYNTHFWECKLIDFMKNYETLKQRLASDRSIKRIPISIVSGKTFDFSAGWHNELQKQIIEEFLPRYGYGATVLYVGDTIKKFIVFDRERLEKLRFPELSHDELPDVVAFSESKNWLYLIEAVFSSGPISDLRLEQLKALTKQCSCGIVFVTAFLNRVTFRKFAPEIAWETEVWIAESPDHMIHFNGDKFLGPHNV